MNANRILRSPSTLLAAASICIGSSAYGAPVIVKGNGSETILQNGSTPISLPVGTTPMDTPTTFTCKSSKGCVALLTVTSAYDAVVGEFEVCSTVDGVEGNPNCLDQTSDYDAISAVQREQLSISQGSHTVATTVTAGNPGSHLLSWETDYTIYEIK